MTEQSKGQCCFENEPESLNFAKRFESCFTSCKPSSKIMLQKRSVFSLDLNIIYKKIYLI